ncbi:helix-turn-helix domain-containing protein [Halolamina sp.]|jgi:DNA-binding transcriptional ArsR family regulator|uniref:helix-turn-helix domain-containing protein n=1 Tax=Halolamina sp. TaxID=1940283 RepID=UPI000223B4F7|nr:Bacterio-opsin activator HTH domain protein [halophilic archaeon DL31]
MRELTFSLEFEHGFDPVTDTFIEYPEIRSDAIASLVGRDRFWQVRQFIGPGAALDRIEHHLLGDGDPDGTATAATGSADQHHERLERSSSTLAVYSFGERLHTNTSVMALAARHLDLGHVLQTHRRKNQQEWRLLMRSEANVGTFYEAVEEHLGSEICLDFGRLGEANHWSFDSVAAVSLSGVERDTLWAATQHGYYEVPREITVGNLAERLDVPQSTVSYRLRRAEEKLVKGYVN